MNNSNLDQKNIKQNYKFLYDNTWNYNFIFIFRKLFFPQPPLTIRHKKINQISWYIIFFIDSLSYTIFFNNLLKDFGFGSFELEGSSFNRLLRYHIKVYVINFKIMSLIITIIPYSIVYFFMPIKILTINFFLVPFLVETLLLCTLLLIPYAIVARIVLRILEFFYAENYCAIQILLLNIDLTRDDAINKPEIKKILLFRMDFLARITLLLSSRYSTKNRASQKWIQKHFQNLSLYIRERQRWLIAPTETTLNDLRQDFYNLAYIYITGKYGLFKWESLDVTLEQAETIVSKRQNLANKAIQLFGFILPLTIMGLYLWQPSWIPFIPNKPEMQNTITLVFIAWFLISIDLTLRLGVIESLLKLLQGLKDLSK